MLQRLVSLTALTLVLVGPVLSAHEEYRIIGTVTKATRTQLDVKTKDGKVVQMDLDKQTKFTRDKKPVPFSELKVGRSVVVDALGDSILDLLAIEVRLVPAIAPSPK